MWSFKKFSDFVPCESQRKAKGREEEEEKEKEKENEEEEEAKEKEQLVIQGSHMGRGTRCPAGGNSVK